MLECNHFTAVQQASASMHITQALKSQWRKRQAFGLLKLINLQRALKLSYNWEFLLIMCSSIHHSLLLRWANRPLLMPGGLLPSLVSASYVNFPRLLFFSTHSHASSTFDIQCKARVVGVGWSARQSRWIAAKMFINSLIKYLTYFAFSLYSLFFTHLSSLAVNFSTSFKPHMLIRHFSTLNCCAMCGSSLSCSSVSWWVPTHILLDHF